jgi:hypothetical protein
MKDRNKQFNYKDLEFLQKFLKGEKISGCNSTDFWRSFEFERFGQEYKITWYHNLSYIHIGESQINFTHFSLDGCWPNSYKLNLNLGTEENIYCIVPLEKYEK